jgi:hypothetical protein
LPCTWSSTGRSFASDCFASQGETFSSRRVGRAERQAGAAGGVGLAASPGVAWKHPAQRRQQDPVVRLEAWPPDLAAKLRAIPAAEEHEQLEHAADDDVQA